MPKRYKKGVEDAERVIEAHKKREYIKKRKEREMLDPKKENVERDPDLDEDEDADS